jgi:hypothetical protein
MISREHVKKVLDVVVEVFFEVLSGNFNTGLVACLFLEVNHLLYGFKSSLLSRDGVVSLKLSNKDLGSFKVRRGITGMINEESVEKISSPLDAMLDLVREVSESAHGDSIFRRILGITVALGEVGHNHLRVGLSSESS